MKIFTSKLMEGYFFENRPRPLIPDKLERTFLSLPFFELQGCVFFDYLVKPESRGKFNFHRYGNRSRCEASVNGFHLQDFCDKKKSTIPIGFLFFEEFVKIWRRRSDENVVIYFGITPPEEEFGPDVTFTFHKKRENETWMNLESIEKLDTAFMVVEI
ncbi:hypothetical protein GNX71_10835 [Variovorax sp. RKNM96]|uniref:hypothetical protein n=1 Tax=Variovorax sp. RKNM96 TaxID=2681552 RepID=UPI00197FE2A8|nr:hypothetical protein [Variovorax sp. RKNM96]QSI30054.1 hypothetical protein GNX71_10835 [Variovorax sp. RKNM96]